MMNTLKTMSLVACLVFTGQAWATEVNLLRVPEGGIQPQAAVDALGNIHLIYFSGEAQGGDISYVRLDADADSFSKKLRVNELPNSAMAIGTVRGPHLALGKGGRPHLTWMDATSEHEDKGMLYTRLNDEGTAFEKQRNITRTAFGLDGGGSIAADTLGRVWVAWHAGQEGEDTRRVWVARSDDEGANFTTEERANPIESGACGCCGMRAFSDGNQLYLLYRAASEMVHRDMTLLTSDARGGPVHQQIVHAWELTTCPMSTAYLASNGDEILQAWETDGQVYYARGDQSPVPAPGSSGKRKHPVVVANARGQVLLVWTEGTGWNQGGDLAWQLFDPQNVPIGKKEQREKVISAWGSATAVSLPGNRFAIVY